MVLDVILHLSLASLLASPLVQPVVVALVDIPGCPQERALLPAPDPLHGHPLVWVIILDLVALTDVAAAVGPVGGDSEEDVGYLEVAAELEQAGTLPLLQLDVTEEGVKILTVLSASLTSSDDQ